MTVEAVLFDWGGTLSTHGDWDLLAMWRAAAEVLSPDDPEPVAQALFDAELAWWHLRVRDGDGTGSGTTEELVRSVEERTHLPVQQAIEAYHGANTHWPRALHERWLDEAGLLEHLDVRLYTSDMTHMKPHPAAFQALIDAVGVTADKAVFVGDRPRDDISGAQGVGMRAVLLTGRHPTEATDVVPDAQLSSLAGLLELVDTW